MQRRYGWPPEGTPVGYYFCVEGSPQSIESQASRSGASWVRLVAVSDCPIGRGRFVMAGEHELAVFRLANPERMIVTQNACPHAGGNLSSGDVCSGVVTCPWHQWEFDLESGACTLAPSVRLRRYPCRVEGGFVYAQLPRL